MTGTPYKLDHEDPFGGKGKTPWISFRGENIADSEFILHFLMKKFGAILKMNYYNEEQLAVATAVRTMMDERTVWGMIMERFVLGSAENMLQVFNMPAIMRIIAKRVILGRAKSQGIGGHAPEDIVSIISKDLVTVSKILGHKRYILGDEPCIEDAGIFGQLSQYYWGLPNNPYEKLLNGECKNLREYCFRMREQFWPDWK
ncbi:unnamed protein product [Allacma fusca]|uniref:Glutathione S-transferase n=1 Tax=Allacma fusca TaxID=39272 RepID=A0A8J2KA40_9HEXA|nr:unnamed protein product [Allacma fusca]